MYNVKSVSGIWLDTYAAHQFHGEETSNSHPSYLDCIFPDTLSPFSQYPDGITLHAHH